jgi:hypothetical protein
MIGISPPPSACKRTEHDYRNSLISYSKSIRYLYNSLRVDRMIVVVVSNVFSKVSIDFIKL